MATNRQPRDTVEEPEDDKSETGTTDSDGEIWVKSSAAGATPSSTKQTGEAECDSISCGDPFCMPVPIDKEGIKRRSRTLTFRRKKTEKSKDFSPSKKHTRFWTTFRLKKKLPGRLRKGKDHGLPDPHPGVDDGTCVCTGYRRTEDHVLGPGIVFSTRSFDLAGGVLRMSGPRGAMLAANSGLVGVAMTNADLLQLVPAPPQSCTSRPVDMPRFNPEEFPVEDIDDLLIAQRARDMEYGIDLVANRNVTHDVSPPRQPGMSMMVGATASEQMWNLSSAFQAHCVLTTAYPVVGNCVPVTQESHYSECQGLSPTGACVPRTVHTQVDFIHCLVPDLLQIANCSFYWGVMDRYEAEKILENRPEGSFLLRDSAQEEFLFSVSFRRYGRSLHARIEQWNHKFSFDSHDPGVYASDTVCGLIEHYKDPSCCMFFEPMLTLPLHRTFPFSLQHLCRAVICSHTTYDGANFLPLPKSLRQYLKYYHYKQKVRVRQFECPH